MLRLESLAPRGLAPIDLNIEPGICVAVTGPSGAGKSVLLRAIADLDPSGGDVLLGGDRRNEIPAPAWRKRVGYLAAEAGWWRDRVGAHFRSDNSATLADLGLPTACLDWPVARLSTGEKQRLAFARLLEGTPEVLLLDEPTGALDPEARDRVEAAILQRLSSGAIVLVVTHDVAQAARLATRRIEVRDGRVEERAP